MDKDIVVFTDRFGEKVTTSRSSLELRRKIILEANKVVLNGAPEEVRGFLSDAPLEISDRELATGELKSDLACVFLNFTQYILYSSGKSSLWGELGGKATLPDKKPFQADYRAERDSDKSGTRQSIVDTLVEHYPDSVRSTLLKWAKEADKEDGFIRKGGRPPKKGS